jgi:hypothetical protein
MENLMVVNWEEKRNKEGHKRATTRGAREIERQSRGWRRWEKKFV